MDFSPQTSTGLMTKETDDLISANATVPCAYISQPTEGESYIVVARDLFQGVEALSTQQSISPRACALIAAHTLECTLKAFLWHKGKKAEIRTIKVRHDIAALWDLAYKERTLNLPDVMPDWVEILASGHGPNFYFRYQEGKKDQEGNKTIVHGGQIPALIPMAVELSKLIEMVKNSIKS